MPGSKSLPRPGALIPTGTVLVTLVTFALATFGLIALARAAVFDFETTPSGGLPVDDDPLVDPYADGTTLATFGFDTNDDLIIDEFPRYEIRGGGGSDVVNAYKTGPTNLGPIDGDFTPTRVGGDWLLRAPGNYGAGLDIRGGDDFLIIYSGTLPNGASGQVWDIDGAGTSFEQWRIEAFDAGGALIGGPVDSPFFFTKNNPPVDSLDAWPWTFSIGPLAVPIKTIRVSWIGSSAYNVGFALDNFDATQPAAVPGLQLWGLVALVALLLLIGSLQLACGSMKPER